MQGLGQNMQNMQNMRGNMRQQRPNGGMMNGMNGMMNGMNGMNGNGRMGKAAQAMRGNQGRPTTYGANGVGKGAIAGGIAGGLAGAAAGAVAGAPLAVAPQLVQPAALAAMVGPWEASCLSQPMPQYVLQEVNTVINTPVNYVTVERQLVPVSVVTAPITSVVTAPPAQLQLNTACPPVFEAPLLANPGCGGCEFAGCGWGGCGLGGPGLLPELATPLAPFGYGYTTLF
jgi:hypothetical protein